MELRVVMGVLDLFSELDSEMPLGQIKALLMVGIAGDNGITMTDLSEKLGIGISTCSRHIGALGSINRYHEAGFKLVEAVEDPLERRRKIITLTFSGQAFIKRLKDKG
jgi:DNA-binding MarR family transcriptional regulator